jgi:tRNA A-37 threonylcarbamoyl transferase component Bud32/GAF domain-containing protein
VADEPAPAQWPGIDDPVDRRRPDRASLAFWMLIAVTVLQLVAASVGFVAIAVDGGLTMQRAMSMATVVAFGAAASWLMAGGGHDDRARYLAAFFFAIASAIAHQFLVPLVGVSGRAFVDGLFPEVFLAYFLWKFVCGFPRLQHDHAVDRWCRIVAASALIAGMALFLNNLAIAYGTAVLPAIFARAHRPGVYWVILILLALPALPVSFVRAQAAPPHERRRLRVFAAALSAGVVLPFAEIAVEEAWPAFRAFMSQPGVRDRAAPLFFAPLLTAPFVTAYAVLVDRVFDVRIVIGRALQYALTRTGIALATLTPVAAIVVVAYQHRDVSLTTLLSGRSGALIASFAVAGGVAFGVRRYVLDVVNSYFLRTEVDFPGELGRISSALRNARSIPELAELLETELPKVLHINGTTMYVADPARRAFVPVRRHAPDLPVDSVLGALVLADPAPLIVAAGDRRSCDPWFGAFDRQWVDETAAALLAPMVSAGDAPLGLLVLGAKRSEIPFGRDEQAFVGALASAAALALDARGGSARASRAGGAVAADDEPAGECLACGRVGAATVTLCECSATRRIAAVPAVLAGKFRVDRLLGVGGMGVVYRGRDLSLDRDVALKTLPRLTGAAADQLAQEARLMASMIHPNLATIFAIESWRHTPILVVEFLEGGTLAQRLREPQSIASVLQLGITMAAALEALHAAGLLHRDIKPSNIAFSAAGTPKLLDFGLARLFEPSRPDALALAGTPLYLSPEAVRGAPPDPGFDVWSLSMVVYEAIAGAHPFAAATTEEVLQRVARARVDDVRMRRPDCPAPIAAIVTGLLSADRASRPASATALRVTLESAARA